MKHGFDFKRLSGFDRFLDLMVAHSNVANHRYGSFIEQLHKVDLMESMRARLKLYEETGNTVHLVDAANYLMMEFSAPDHPTAHFRETDPEESPGNKQWGGDFIRGPVRED